MFSQINWVGESWVTQSKDWVAACMLIKFKGWSPLFYKVELKQGIHLPELQKCVVSPFGLMVHFYVLLFPCEESIVSFQLSNLSN